MAKATLPTNFKDDVLASAMGGKRRYNMIHNSDGTVSFEDVTNYTQVGSTFGAAQINATNEAVNNAADASKIIDSLETIKANTQSGYIAGALAVKALNSNLGASFFVVAAQTNASEAISITASMAAPKSGYYKIESCNGTWDQIYMDVQLNTNTYTYVDEGKIIGVRIIKSSGVQGRFKAKLSYKENI